MREEMDSINYTPTPWAVRDYPNNEGGYWIDCNAWKHSGRGGCRGGTIGATYDVGNGPEGTAYANAARIIAAVNACDGLSNEALKAGVIQDLLRALRLQMCWRMRDGSPCCCPAGENEDDETKRPKKMMTIHSSRRADARAALAKAESGTRPPYQTSYAQTGT